MECSSCHLNKLKLKRITVLSQKSAAAATKAILFFFVHGGPLQTRSGKQIIHVEADTKKYTTTVVMWNVDS